MKLNTHMLKIIFILIIFSAFISGAEVAFFSLSPTDIEEIERDKKQESPDNYRGKCFSSGGV